MPNVNVPINITIANPFLGFRIVESQYMTILEERTHNRSWKERLFTVPWQPFKKTITYTVQVPSQEFFVDEKNGVIYCHPVTAKMLQEYVLR